MSVLLEAICLPLRPVQATTSCAAVLSFFLSDPAVHALPVLDGMQEGAPRLSLITRARLTEALAGPNGRDVYAARPVRHLMTPDPFIADGKMAVAQIGSQIAEGAGSALNDGVIVTQEGAYKGVVFPAAILKVIAEENAARARSLQASRKRLDTLRLNQQSLVEDRGRFLAFLGHEIRTPLSGILGVADLMRAQAGTAEMRRLADTIASSGEHLERLLTDLVDLSRLQAGKLPLKVEPFDLRGFAAEVRDLWQPKLDAKRVALRVMVARTCEPRVESDQGRLRQIVFNLISNAVKFTDRGQVMVRISTINEDRELRLKIAVSDTGRGISDADKLRIFEEFEQAGDTITATPAGAGLGLSIARELTRRLGGDISLEDNPGGGCVFTVNIPVRRAGPRLAAVSSGQSSYGKFELGQVLVAEDHETTGYVIREALIAAGWRVDLVTDAAMAVQFMGQRRYQAIITDLHMPGGGGDAVLRAARFHKGANRQIPILALTGDTGADQGRLHGGAGFSAVIAKPVRPGVLVAALADAVLAAQQPARMKAG